MKANNIINRQLSALSSELLAATIRLSANGYQLTAKLDGVDL